MERSWLPKQTVWATMHTGSGRPFKPTREMLEVIEKMKQDDETTVTQLMKMLEEGAHFYSNH